MAQDCVFCKIKARELESVVLYEDDHCFVIRDLAPRAPIHLLVIPNRHFTYLANLEPHDGAMMAGLFMAAKEMAKREGVADGGYRLVINQGESAGQQVPHLHLHLLAGRPLRSMG